ncbi:LPXTG cell wall anchor domain-containing protein [Streptomyces sp. NPDC005708]|uniref:LPXTG cell wall anchor domain-containing protein n=1 Tax=unclassified Streptomyces TaxID=2593676 RepID=UPI0033E1BBDE
MTTSPRWRVALASAASVAMLVAAPLAGAQAAHAQPYPPSSALGLDLTTVARGQQLHFHTAAGLFRFRQRVLAILESTPIILGRFHAHHDGSVSGTVTIPRRAPAGWHVFRLAADHPDISLGATIYVLGGTATTPPGGHNATGGGRNGSRGRGATGGTVNYRHQNQHVNQNRSSLAATGDDQALALGGTAAALLLAGGGTLLAVRRRHGS